MVMRANGTFLYVADSGYSGPDYFSYRVRCDLSDDGSGVYAYSVPAIVRVRIGGSDGDAGSDGSGRPSGAAD